jgi:DNA end-binding protein Ku
MRTGIWKGSVSFGLINIPIIVESAEEDHDLHFRMLDKKDLSPIKYNRLNAKTGRVVPYGDIVKGYEYEKNKFIILTPADFKNASPKLTRLIDIHTFVKLNEIDLVLFERPYYLVPQNGAEKAYFLLQQALIDSNKVAVAKVVMHTKEHLVAIVPRGKYLILEEMRFAHTIKNADQVHYLKGTPPKFSPQELKMAERLINDMTSKWKPDQYQDTYYQDLKKHIDRRIKAGKGKKIDKITTEKPTKISATRSKDLMGLLKASLEAKHAH